MSDSAPISKAWHVGKFTVTFVGQRRTDGKAPEVLIFWDPRKPKRPLTQSEASQYRAGRDAFANELGKMLGGRIEVLEKGNV